MAILVAAVIGLAVWDIRPEDDNTWVIRDRLELTYDAISIMARAEQWWRFTGTDAAA